MPPTPVRAGPRSCPSLVTSISLTLRRAPHGRRQGAEGEWWEGGPAQAGPKEPAPTSSHRTPLLEVPPAPAQMLPRVALSIRHVQTLKCAGSHASSSVASELGFRGPEEPFATLLEPFTDQFVTTDDRERMLLAAEALTGLAIGYF